MRFLLFGLGKKMHDRASHAPGSHAATIDLARAVPADAAFPTWILATLRMNELRLDPIRPIDRHAFVRVQKRRTGESLPAVALLRRRWLPYSEVFVYNEARALSQYRPLAVCKERHGDPWPGIPVLPLGDLPPDRAAPLLSRAGVVVAHAVFATCATSFLGLARALDVPLLVSVRGHDLYREPREDLRAVFEAAALFLARNEMMADDLAHRGCPRQKVRVVVTGVDLDRFRYRDPEPPRDRLRVVAASRFTPKKGISDLLNAFAILARADPRARLTVYGLGHVDEDPAVVGEARALCAQAPLAGKVALSPAVPQPVLARALAAGHLFLCASKTAPDGDREGIPNALKEAMAVGLPVVATRHAGIPALIEAAGKGGASAGVLAPEGDAAALGEALRSLARDVDRWTAVARAARAHIEREFDLRRVVRQLEDLYASLAGHRREATAASVKTI